MKPLTAVARYAPDPALAAALRPLAQSALVESLTLLSPSAGGVSIPGAETLSTDAPFSEETLGALLGSSRTPYLLFLPDCVPVDIGQPAMERMIGAARATGAGIVYADYYEGVGRTKRIHPLIDYSPGSVRDDFAFGPVLLISVEAARNAAGRRGVLPGSRFAGLYDLRLKLSIDHKITHLAEPLYTVHTPAAGSGPGVQLFDYVDPRNRAFQKEMEAVFTDYLQKIGARVPAARLRSLDAAGPVFPVEASVIIPVRNREKTIAQAITARYHSRPASPST